MVTVTGMSPDMAQCLDTLLLTQGRAYYLSVDDKSEGGYSGGNVTQ